MDVPSGFAAFPGQGPFLEHIAPVHVREEGEERVIVTPVAGTTRDAIDTRPSHGQPDRRLLKAAKPGAWIESRTRVDRVGGTLAFADCSLTVEGREIVRARAVWVVAD